MAVEIVESRVVSVPTAARLLGISRNYGYEMCRTGQLRCIKLGRRILIPKSAIEKLLEGGESAAEEDLVVAATGGS